MIITYPHGAERRTKVLWGNIHSQTELTPSALTDLERNYAPLTFNLGRKKSLNVLNKFISIYYLFKPEDTSQL